MTNFVKYQHVERLGKPDTDGILFESDLRISCKLDGTNASVWVNPENDEMLCAGSRTRELSLESDNAGFYAWCQQKGEEQDCLRHLLMWKPYWNVFGEFLGTTKLIGSIKAYDKEVALNAFWIYDVFDRETGLYLSYEEWIGEVTDFGLAEWVIPSIPVERLTVPELEEKARELRFLMPKGSDHLPEGIVIKSAKYRSLYGRQQYAKLVLDEYRQEKAAKKKVALSDVEAWIVNEYLTDAEIAKAIAKCELQFNEEFDNKCGKHIGYVMNVCFNESVVAETPNFVKKLKNPTVNFHSLKALCDKKVREYANIG